MRKKIAWGASKLLKLYLAQAKSNPFSYCVDDFSDENNTGGIPIRKSNSIFKEKKGNFEIVIFAVSNTSLQEISARLNEQGLNYGKDFVFYSDFFYKDFVKKAEKNLCFKLTPKFYKLALSFTLNSRTLIHTTILGTWLFLELLNRLNNIKGSIAELGAFQGGNALAGLQFMSRLNSKKFYIVDSFAGFPKLSQNDPKNFKKGDYNIKTTFAEIQDAFSLFPEAVLIKGFIPQAFKNIPAQEKFSLVFYDCDIYRPALDTFEFFWDKIVPGGYLLIHDYEAEAGGFTGVKKATDEFFGKKDVKLFSFFSNTMAVIKKK